MINRYGQKGGNGPNQGKKSTLYSAEAPDGTTLKKRTFHTNELIALMSIYQHDGKWHAASIHSIENTPDWFFRDPKNPPIKCIRVSS